MLLPHLRPLWRDRTTLQQQFDLDLQGDDQSWSLALTPRDAHVRQRVLSITVVGAGNEPRCITTRQPNDTTTIMLMA